MYAVAIAALALGCSKSGSESSDKSNASQTAGPAQIQPAEMPAHVHAAPPATPAKEEPKAGPAATAAPSAAAPASAAAAQGEVTELTLESVGETMAYNQTTLKVVAGRKVHLTLKNNAKSELMPHNWALVKPGTEAAVALAGVDLKDQGYVPPGNESILASTSLATPGKTVEVTFTAPPPGSYPYVCTVPGHYIMMKGTLVSSAP
jgi:azurin